MKKIMIALLTLAITGIFLSPTAQGCDMAKLEKLAAYVFEKGSVLEGVPAVFLEKIEPLAGSKEKRMYLTFFFAMVNGTAVVYKIHAIEELWETSDNGVITVHQKMAIDGEREIDGKPDSAMTGLLVKEKDGKILRYETFPMSLEEAEVWHTAFIDEMYAMVPEAFVPEKEKPEAPPKEEKSKPEYEIPPVPDILAPVRHTTIEI